MGLDSMWSFCIDLDCRATMNSDVLVKVTLFMVLCRHVMKPICMTCILLTFLCSILGIIAFWVWCVTKTLTSLNLSKKKKKNSLLFCGEIVTVFTCKSLICCYCFLYYFSFKNCELLVGKNMTGKFWRKIIA